MQKQTVIALLATLAISLSSETLQGRDASCNYLAGQLVFQDTLYGLAIGSLMAGLSVLAREDEPKYQRPLANGALVGSVLGLGFGVYEVANRSCQLVELERPDAKTMTTPYRIGVRPILANDRPAWQLAMSWRF